MGPARALGRRGEDRAHQSAILVGLTCNGCQGPSQSLLSDVIFCVILINTFKGGTLMKQTRLITGLLALSLGGSYGCPQGLRASSPQGLCP